MTKAERLMGRRSMPTWTLMARELKSGACTAEDLAFVTKLRPRRMYYLLNLAHAGGLVYISHYERPNRNWTAVYAYGRGEDAPKPDPVSNAEACRRYRKNNPEKYSAVRKRYYLANREKRIAKTKEWRQLNKDKIRQYNEAKNGIRQLRDPGTKPAPQERQAA